MPVFIDCVTNEDCIETEFCTSGTLYIYNADEEE